MVKKILTSIIDGSALIATTEAIMPNTTCLSSNAEATVVSIVGNKYMVDIDDTSVYIKGPKHAAVNIRVYHEKPGWGYFFPVDVMWGKGFSVTRIDTGATMESSLSLAVANYMNEHY